MDNDRNQRLAEVARIAVRLEAETGVAESSSEALVGEYPNIVVPFCQLHAQLDQRRDVATTGPGHEEEPPAAHERDSNWNQTGRR